MSKEEDETERQLNSNPIRRRSRSRTMESRPRYFLEGGKWDIGYEDRANKSRSRFFHEGGKWDIGNQDGIELSDGNIQSRKFQWEKKSELAKR